LVKKHIKPKANFKAKKYPIWGILLLICLKYNHKKSANRVVSALSFIKEWLLI